MQIPHKRLHGKERLHHVVECLSRSCPWTKSITSEVMLSFLESEVHELRDELSLIKKSGDSSGQSSEIIDGDVMKSRDALVSEVGDILFDVLMLEMAIRREYRLGLDEAWQVAAEKVERRTPYVEEWGDGVTRANTVEDTERIWQEVKRKEKAEAEAKINDVSTTEVNNGSHVLHKDRSKSASKIKVGEIWRKLKRHDGSLGTAALAFTLGVMVSRLMMGRPR